MYDFPISSSSPLFDMLAKILLEFLFNLPFWTYLPFALFTMCLVPLFSFQINAALDSFFEFWFQSISPDSKILRWPMPRILMPVQVIKRMELLVHHEESRWNNWNCTTYPRSYSSWMNSIYHQRIKPERDYDSHYCCNHGGGVNAGQVEGGACHQC